MSPRRIARILALGAVSVLAIIAVTAVWLVNYRSGSKSLASKLDLVPDSLLHARNFHWTQMKGSDKQWELSASEANYSADKTAITLKGTELLMTLEDGKKVRLRAPAALLKLDGNRVTEAQLSGGLEVHYGVFVVTTPQATYLPDGDKIEAPGAVLVEGEGLRVSGLGLEAYPRAQKFALLREVTTVLAGRPRASRTDDLSG